MGSKEKLDRMCVSADKEAKRQLARHTGDLAVLVAAVLRSRRWMDLPLKTRRRLDETGQAACDAADLADAAEYTNDRLLDAANGLVVDLTLKRDLRAMQDQIHAYSTQDRRRPADSSMWLGVEDPSASCTWARPVTWSG